METYYLGLVAIGVIAYIMILDANVGIYLSLVFKMIRVNVRRTLWLIRFHPSWFNNPISKLRRERHYLKLIKEMEKHD